MWILCVRVGVMCAYGFNGYLHAVLGPAFLIRIARGMAVLIFTIIEF